MAPTQNIISTTATPHDSIIWRGIHPPYRTDSPESVRLDSLQAVADSMAVNPMARPTKGILFQASHTDSIAMDIHTEFPAPQTDTTRGMNDSLSWVFITLGVIFCLISLRFHNNARYIKALTADLFDVRVRHNLFDDTVRETMLLLMLNALWCVTSGVLIYTHLAATLSDSPAYPISLTVSPAAGCGICAVVCAIYTLAMTCIYWAVGMVFSDRIHTSMWIKGFTSSQALCAAAFFPLSLAALCWPQASSPLVIAGIACFCIARLIFIFKGIRIFFSHLSSWILFLYYLCSLEIIPLLLTYIACIALCTYT